MPASATHPHPAPPGRPGHTHTGAAPRSLLLGAALGRVAVAAGVVLLLWAAVAWALSA